MKRFIAIVVLLSLFVMTSAAEAADMGISTQSLLDDFAEYRDQIGLKHYPTNLFERELTAKHVNLQISDYCRIDIQQADSQVVGFTVVTDDVKQTDAVTQDVIMTFTGIMMVSNREIDTTNAVSILTDLVNSRDEMTIGGITYYYSTGQPKTNIIALRAYLPK